MSNNKNSQKYFHFTLGPVQSFVAQARRTRDFWAGSFLLSWLSAVAIKAVEVQGGELLFPKVEPDYLDWLENKGKKGREPQQGCIPNRFKGGLAKVPKDFNPEDVVESVKQAWQGLADEVWKNDLEDLKNRPEKTKEIWKRQVENFWEISWVLEDESEKHYSLSSESKELLTKEQLPKELLIKLAVVFDKKIKGKDAFLTFLANSIGATDSKKYENIILKYASNANLLDRRKNWRSYLPPEEAGVKCMMMDGWQELSGIETPNAKGLGLFWEALRKETNSLKNDLRPSEYLCAIAFIKRRFAHVFHKLQKIDMQNGKWKLYGWELSSAVPSVSYMAAAPWLAKVLEVAPEKELLDFHNKARDLTEGYGEYKTNLHCIKEVIDTKKAKLFFWSLSSLDGDVFFESALDNKNRHEDQEQAQEVKKALIALRQAVNKELEVNKKLEPVSPFYAVLMMDGDSLGSQMSDLQKQIPISNALNHFTKHVPKKVEEHSGFLIYAGGDDVLALLPLEKALDCAYQLRGLYLDSFKRHGEGKVSSTLSGAIEYAHIKIPLGKVLGDAHHLLDDVAKNYCGRDSIAVRVWKSSGQHLQWAMPWEKAAKDDEVIINTLVTDFQKTEQETPFSNSFFFNVEARFSMLQTKNDKGELALAEGFDPDTIIKKLIAAEYLNSGVNAKRKVDKITLAEAEEKIAPLISQCMPVKRNFEQGKNGAEDKEEFINLHQLNIDAAHFIRFLVSKGVERG